MSKESHRVKIKSLKLIGEWPQYTYEILPFFSSEFPNMGNKRLNMGNVFPNMGNECPNMGNSIPYIKEYRKEYKKRDVEKRARTREQQKSLQ